MLKLKLVETSPITTGSGSVDHVVVIVDEKEIVCGVLCVERAGGISPEALYKI